MTPELLESVKTPVAPSTLSAAAAVLVVVVVTMMMMVRMRRRGRRIRVCLQLLAADVT